MTKEEIITATQKTVDILTQTCSAADDIIFFERPGNKWSIAQNVQHLILATNTSALAFQLPTFIVKLIGGKPNRSSRTFDELLAKYNKKLADGATASSRFVPKPIEIKFGKEKLMNNWEKATAKFITALQKNRTEQDLDNYLVKHPLLGRITLRELCYFTIFHTEHHLNSISKINNPSQ